MNLNDYLRDVPDFPKQGIVFKDISPLLGDVDALRHSIDEMVACVSDLEITRVAAIESRGFLFGAPLALALNVGFTPIRKPGKLPWHTNSIEYVLEYGTDALEIHKDGVHGDDSVLVVDDVLATGGTAKAACELIEGIGASVAACVFLLELGFLEGRKKLAGRRLHAILGET